MLFLQEEIDLPLRNETMEWRLCLYSCRGTCWKAAYLSGRQASFAPKNTVTAKGSPPPSTRGNTFSKTCSAHLVLYPPYPLRTTSTYSGQYIYIYKLGMFQNLHHQPPKEKNIYMYMLEAMKGNSTVRAKWLAREAPQPPSSKENSVIESPKR